MTHGVLPPPPGAAPLQVHSHWPLSLMVALGAGTLVMKPLPGDSELRELAPASSVLVTL